jgi:hypothetical protein
MQGFQLHHPLPEILLALFEPDQNVVVVLLKLLSLELLFAPQGKAVSWQ